MSSFISILLDFRVRMSDISFETIVAKYLLETCDQSTGTYPILLHFKRGICDIFSCVFITSLNELGCKRSSNYNRSFISNQFIQISCRTVKHYSPIDSLIVTCLLISKLKIVLCSFSQR